MWWHKTVECIFSGLPGVNTSAPCLSLPNLANIVATLELTGPQYWKKVPSKTGLKEEKIHA